MDNVTKITAEADLHCHLLPAWDDGPRDREESLRMAARAAQSGLKTILVTPHVDRRLSSAPERAPQDIPAATAALEGEIRASGIEIRLVPAAELHLGTANLPQRIAAEPWLTVGGQGRYALVESPVRHWPDYAEQMLFQISLQGVTSIIAHPERLVDVQKDIGIMEKVVSQGALLQITARSLTGDERATKQCSLRLLEAGLVSFVASDAHSSRSVLPGEAESVLRSTVGDDAARQILVDNPRLALAGQPLPVREAPVLPPQRTRSWLERVMHPVRQARTDALRSLT